MKKEGLKFEESNYDDLRTIINNIPQFNDVPILAQEQGFEGIKSWTLNIRVDEVFKGLGAVIFLDEYMDMDK